jgi:hypothetical protein
MKWVIVSLFTYWAIKRVFRIINVVKNQDQSRNQNNPNQSTGNDDGFTDFEEVE